VEVPVAMDVTRWTAGGSTHHVPAMSISNGSSAGEREMTMSDEATLAEILRERASMSLVNKRFALNHPELVDAQHDMHNAREICKILTENDWEYTEANLEAAYAIAKIENRLKLQKLVDIDTDAPCRVMQLKKACEKFAKDAEDLEGPAEVVIASFRELTRAAVEFEEIIDAFIKLQEQSEQETSN
jgi:hypothetical protein